MIKSVFDSVSFPEDRLEFYVDTYVRGMHDRGADGRRFWNPCFSWSQYLKCCLKYATICLALRDCSERVHSKAFRESGASVSQLFAVKFLLQADRNLINLTEMVVKTRNLKSVDDHSRCGEDVCAFSENLSFLEKMTEHWIEKTVAFFESEKLGFPVLRVVQSRL